jgi:hypothetical protein
MKTLLLLSISFIMLLSTVSCKKKNTIEQPDPEPIENDDSTQVVQDSFSKLTSRISGMKNQNGKMNIAI